MKIRRLSQEQKVRLNIALRDARLNHFIAFLWWSVVAPHKLIKFQECIDKGYLFIIAFKVAKNHKK